MNFFELEQRLAQGIHGVYNDLSFLPLMGMFHLGADFPPRITMILAILDFTP